MAAPTCTDCAAPLEFHCESPMCEWWSCPTRKCPASIYDVEHGTRIMNDGRLETWAES